MINLKLKVQGRYVMTTLLLITTVVLITSWVHFSVFEKHSNLLVTELSEHNSTSLQSQLQKRGESLINYLSAALYDPIYRLNIEACYDVILPALNSSEVTSIRVLDSDGYIFHDGTEALTSFGQAFENDSVLHETLVLKKSYAQVVGNELQLAAPIVTENTVIGAVYMTMTLKEIRNDSERITEIIRKIEAEENRITFRLYTIVNLSLIVAALIFSILIARSMVKPLRQLMLYADKIGNGEYEAIKITDRVDEIGELADALGVMGGKLEQRSREVSFLAYHDPLTRLPNRSSLIEYIDRKIQNEDLGVFTLLFIDLDEFKSVNDNFGHDAGDQLLEIVAKRLLKALRPNLTLDDSSSRERDVVARIGGDEFLAYLDDVNNQNDIVSIATRLLEVIRKPVMLDQQEVFVGASIGAASYPEMGSNSEEIIKNADIAMYAAKSAGKNTINIFSSKLSKDMEEKIDLERELRKAVLDLSQFEIWYQPQFNLSTGAMIGAESLIRWRHPERGIIGPDKFIPIAETTGLINPIGDWIIESVCSQLQTWRMSLPVDFHIAINLSARQMYQRDLFELFEKHIMSYGIDQTRIHVEITETMLMIDEEEATRILFGLRESGIEIWLDDFGTGFSSLNNIRLFPVSGIKIDKSFIFNMEVDEKNRTLTYAITTMSKCLGLPVVAEGVETASQAKLLEQYDCAYVQGYLYSKPLPALEFEQRYLPDDQKTIAPGA